MGWKIIVDDKELLPDTKIDENNIYQFRFINDDTHGAISVIGLLARFSVEKPCKIQIYTSNDKTICKLSEYGYLEETLDDINYRFACGGCETLNELAIRFVQLRKIDPSLREVMTNFFSHPGMPFDMPLAIKMDIIVQFIEKNNFEAAIKFALARQHEKNFSEILVGKMLEQAYTESQGAISYLLIIKFYLGVTAKCERFSRAMQALYKFCMNIDASQFTAEQKMKLKEERFRAALLTNDESTEILYHQLCGRDHTISPMPMKFTCIPEVAAIDVLIASAQQERMLRQQLKEQAAVPVVKMSLFK